MGGKVLELESDRLIARGKQEGRREGISEGLEKGKHEGQALQNQKIALKMHRQGYDIPSIADLLEIAPETVTQWIAQSAQ